LSLLGATIGATVAFLLARCLAADWVERRLGRRLQEIKARVEHQGWRFVAFVRLVPVFPFNLLNYVLGLTSLSVRTFAVTSFFALAPGALVYAYLGYAGREAIGGGPDLVRKAFLGLTLLVALALLPSLIRRWRGPRMCMVDHARQGSKLYQGRTDNGATGTGAAGCLPGGSASGKRRT
jgi:uncharacterized membrane protein YdjX (TVP38/TMEM64 family)